MKKHLGIIGLWVWALFLLAGCGGTASSSSSLPAEPSPPTVKAGFVYAREIAYSGAVFSHDQARQQVADALGVQTLWAEDIPADGAEAAIRQLMADGCNVIFTTDAIYADVVVRLASAHPEVCFFQYGEMDAKDNLASYSARMYEGWYLAGIAAGMKTDANQVGVLSPEEGNSAKDNVKAFAAGVARAKPEAQVTASPLSPWPDPDGERENTALLIQEGCDVIASMADSHYPLTAAQAGGAAAIGCYLLGDTFAPDAYMTAVLWDWGGYYTQMVKNVMDGDFTASHYSGGLAEGVVTLDPLTENCAPGTEDALEAAWQETIDGSLGADDMLADHA